MVVHHRVRPQALGTGAMLLCALSVVAACGTSKQAPSTSSSPPASASPHQTIAVTPSRGLNDHQTVHVLASGFKPNEAHLVITECADKGTATGPGDCNLNGTVPVRADASGQVGASFTVLKGPFGTSHIVCGPSQKCEISVSQETLNPTEEADTHISFAP